MSAPLIVDIEARLCYAIKRAEREVTPNLMSRFREEYYDTPAYKAACKEKQTVRRFPERAEAAFRAAIRAEYFRKSRARYRAPDPAWKRLDA